MDKTAGGGKSPLPVPSNKKAMSEFKFNFISNQPDAFAHCDLRTFGEKG